MGKFVISKRKEKVYFNLHSGNNEIILSSQGYAARKGALKGINSIKKNAPKAPIENQTLKGYAKLGNPKFEVYQDKAKKFRFRLISSNGKCIGHSEGYNTLAACKNGIAAIKKNASSPIVNERDLEKKAVAKKPATKKVVKKAAPKKAAKKVVKKVAKKPAKKAPAKKVVKKPAKKAVKKVAKKK